MAKYFLKSKGHTHNIFVLRTGQNKAGKSSLTYIGVVVYNVHCVYLICVRTIDFYFGVC